MAIEKELDMLFKAHEKVVIACMWRNSIDKDAVKAVCDNFENLKEKFLSAIAQANLGEHSGGDGVT